MGNTVVVQQSAGTVITLPVDVVAKVLANAAAQSVAVSNPVQPVSRATNTVIAQMAQTTKIGGQGQQGPPGTSLGNIGQYEFAAIDSMAATFSVPNTIQQYHALYLNGVRQPKSTYSVSGTNVSIPAGILFAGADVFFEYAY